MVISKRMIASSSAFCRLHSVVCIFLANGPLANNKHARPSARHLWLAHDAALLLRGETAKGPERTYRNGLTLRILDAAGVISPQAVLGNPIPFDM